MEVDNCVRLLHPFQVRAQDFAPPQLHFFTSWVKPLKELFIVVHKELLLVERVSLVFLVTRLFLIKNCLAFAKTIFKHSRLVQLRRRGKDRTVFVHSIQVVSGIFIEVLFSIWIEKFADEILLLITQWLDWSNCIFMLPILVFLINNTSKRKGV